MTTLSAKKNRSEYCCCYIYRLRPTVSQTSRTDRLDRLQPNRPHDVNQINVACQLVVIPPTLQRDWSSDWPVGLTSRTQCPHASTVGSAVGRNQTCLILPTVCPTGRTKRLHDTIVGPTSLTDQSDQPVGPTIGTCKRPVKLTSNVPVIGRQTKLIIEFI